MSTFQDLRDHIFHRLTVLERVLPNAKQDHARWLCQCTCGNTTIVTTGRLKGHSTRSCGCLQEESRRIGSFSQKHGKSYTPEYRIFHGLKQRCTNPNDKNYPSYGGRGITVAWDTFEAFYNDIGPRPGPKYTIERINNDGPYSRDNCIWATRETQNRNKRDTIKIPYNGSTYTLKELAALQGITRNALYQRFAKARAKAVKTANREEG